MKLLPTIAVTAGAVLAPPAVFLLVQAVERAERRVDAWIARRIATRALLDAGVTR